MCVDWILYAENSFENAKHAVDVVAENLDTFFLLIRCLSTWRFDLEQFHRVYVKEQNRNEKERVGKW